MIARSLAALVGIALAGSAWGDVCAVSVSAPNFGDYDTTSRNPTDAVGQVRISCVSGASIAISAGGAGTFFPRAMTSGTATLAYNLYTDAARTRIWGEWGTGTEVRFVAQGSNRSVPVFGRIPPLQDVPSGLYTDTLVATVYF
ncbi:MAG TPA: spore coat U domain-containing protein [Anaeromyxobacteraceae bacterium]|nr:spore coat U domain-containing protein [Anaeromyxobacteraceae bacterium]